MREFLDFFQFYIIVYKENSAEIEWAVVGSEKDLISAYADVPVQDRPSWQVYAAQEPFHIADWDADERVPNARFKQGIAAQGLRIRPAGFCATAYDTASPAWARWECPGPLEPRTAAKTLPSSV